MQLADAMLVARLQSAFHNQRNTLFYVSYIDPNMLKMASTHRLQSRDRRTTLLNKPACLSCGLRIALLGTLAR